MFNFFRPKFPHGTGCLPDPVDKRDFRFEGLAAAGEPVDWDKGFDIENKLDIKIPLKHQDGSGSCVGQGWSYYVAILNTVETGFYKEASAKSIYSLISLGLPTGGAYIRDGAKLIVNWGALLERQLSSYDEGNPPSEAFMANKLWKTPEMDKLAKVLQAKEYRTFDASSLMNMFAMAIRDGYGVVGGLRGDNNGTWSSNEPKPPTKSTWAHCEFYGKFGTDELGKFVSTPNSWGRRGCDELHPDGWQKHREEWFDSRFMFNPWTLIDKPNVVQMSDSAKRVIKDYEKKFVLEAEGPGRKGIIIGGELRPIQNEREAAASIYVQNNNGNGVTVTSKLFDELPKGANF